ncbi:DUF3867 family protein [Proteiniclasticum sp. QWL-01]|uniref:DUF3867 family protein n=1 Tax=Proteiniclasticum sp. QWL-01 TaxID=3036945 RepID=UPI002200A833|nr:DUF3867 family protein [Proteiniclasticum sp. QWL-01]UUM12486.1 DUF3867 family protein [Clostridiaceae bacterium HFYG-1003]WFF74053.1 DUF3867 family protein [Proteiniclasticum sp. QWL-01]
MSDIIDLSKFKEKVRDKDVDELENYIYSLYFQVAEGKMTLADVNREIRKYVEENDISHTKFMEIQKKLIERYGYDPNELEKQLMQDPSLLGQSRGLLEKYGKSIEEAKGYRKVIKNNRNELVIFATGHRIILLSEKKIDLEDNEVHEFLVSYKRQAGSETLDVQLAESIQTFQY